MSSSDVVDGEDRGEASSRGPSANKEIKDGDGVIVEIDLWKSDPS